MVQDWALLVLLLLPKRYNKLEIKSIVLPPGTIHTGRITRISCCRWVELITIWTVTIPSIYHNSEADFYVLENFRRKISESWPPSTKGTANCLMRWKSTSGPLTDGGNSVQIVILPQTGKKIYQNFGSEFGALLWRHLTPQKKNEI